MKLWQNQAMANVGETTRRPGTLLIQIGLLLAGIGLFLAIMIISGGGTGQVLWLTLAGLVLAGIGFGMRVLAALERR